MQTYWFLLSPIVSLLSQQGSDSSIVGHFSNQNVFFPPDNIWRPIRSKSPLPASHMKWEETSNPVFLFSLRAAWTRPLSSLRVDWLVTSVGLSPAFVCQLWFCDTTYFYRGTSSCNEQTLLLTTTTVMHLYKHATNALQCLERGVYSTKFSVGRGIFSKNSRKNKFWGKNPILWLIFCLF